MSRVLLRKTGLCFFKYILIVHRTVIEFESLTVVHQLAPSDGAIHFNNLFIAGQSCNSFQHFILEIYMQHLF